MTISESDLCRNFMLIIFMFSDHKKLPGYSWQSEEEAADSKSKL